MTMPLAALATDIPGVQPAALDQPRINALLTRGPVDTGTLLTADFGTGATFNITAFFDTGASGILLSEDTADALGVNRQTVNGQNAIFTDVGVGGSSQFNISEQLHVGLAKYHPDADVDNTDTYTTVYNQRFGPLRTQIGPLNVSDPNLEGLDVFGTPTMAGKVVVFDPKPVNTFFDTMRTYVYNPGTPFDPNHANDEPGIPQLNDASTSRHIKLSYANFDRFTQTTPGAEPPTTADNPFIGPNPLLQLGGGQPDNTPPVKIGYGVASTSGSFLLDTGAAASMISTGKAQALGVSYDPAHPIGSDHPELLGVPQADQFTLTIGGTGGTFKVAGFFLDSMLVRTNEGNPADDNDEHHLRFTRAPVLVADIGLEDPITHQQLTLDGIFGMNYLVASAFVTETDDFPIIDHLTYGNFDWAVFDQPNGVLGLQLAQPRPQGELQWVGFSLSGGDGRAWNIDGADNWFDSNGFAVYQDGDHVRFDDNTVETSVRIEEPVAPGGITIDNTDEANYSFYGNGSIRGFTGLIKMNTGSVEFYTSNSYTGTTDVLGGTIIYFATQNIGPVVVHSGASVYFHARQHLEAINVDGGLAQMNGNGGRLLDVSRVAVVNNGTLDLSDNPMIIHETEQGAVQALIRQARAGGAWTGSGITSTAAAARPGHATTLGVLSGQQYKSLYGASALFYNTAVQDSDTLVKYTWYGDTDFNGIVNFDDYVRTDNGFNNHLTGWLNGDFDLNNVVNFDDYVLIDLAFNTQSGTLGRALAFLDGSDRSNADMDGAALRRMRNHFQQFGDSYARGFLAAVPEPVMVAPALALCAILRRRRSTR